MHSYDLKIKPMMYPSEVGMGGINKYNEIQKGYIAGPGIEPGTPASLVR